MDLLPCQPTNPKYRTQTMPAYSHKQTEIWQYIIKEQPNRKNPQHLSIHQDTDFDSKFQTKADLRKWKKP